MLAVSLAFGQHYTLTGTWVPDHASVAAIPMASNFQVTFWKDGTVSLDGYGTKGTGRYSINGRRVEIRLTKVRGSKQPRSAVCTVAENGNALLFDTGLKKNGKLI